MIQSKTLLTISTSLDIGLTYDKINKQFYLFELVPYII